MSGPDHAAEHDETAPGAREVLTDEDLGEAGAVPPGGPDALSAERAERDESSPGAPDETPGSDDPEFELSLVRAERDEYLDALRRLKAEFENFRKRTERHAAELSARAAESLIERLLPVLDAFDLALAHARESDADADLTTAFAQIEALFGTALEREGLERIDESGASFDPTVHDAVAHEAWDDDADAAANGVVVDEVLRAGYRLKGRVLRPAMVKVRG